MKQQIAAERAYWEYLRDVDLPADRKLQEKTSTETGVNIFTRKEARTNLLVKELDLNVQFLQRAARNIGARAKTGHPKRFRGCDDGRCDTGFP